MTLHVSRSSLGLMGESTLGKLRNETMKTNTILAATFATAASTALIFADHHKSGGESEAAVEPTKNIVEIAADSEDFSTLVAAVKAAGLAETLKGQGPFTVFAPTNAAFEALPEGRVVELLKPENKEELTEILTYHVVPKKILSKNAAPMPLTTVQGSDATMTLDGDTVMIDGAKIIEADVMATNGVIHVIDQVIMPSEGEEDEE